MWPGSRGQRRSPPSHAASEAGTSPRHAAMALTDFDQDFIRQYLIVALSDALIDHAAVLSEPHAAAIAEGMPVEDPNAHP